MIDNMHADRRSFLRTGAVAGTALLAGAPHARTQQARASGSSASLTEGDVSILQFLAAVETIEADLWIQYAELGGAQDNDVPGVTGGSSAFMAALQNLDADMPQYISDNTDDEISHAAFLNAYLASKGATTVNLDPFRTLPSSKATGARQIGRLTNLMQLTVDTSWWVRYRSSTLDPDLDPNSRFPQAVPSLSSGRFPAIPRTDADLSPQGHIQAIANTAGFHFCFIEQGGTSLYPTLAQKVSHPEVLRILLSIGPTETAHFQTWHDKAGNAVSDPLAPLTDPADPRLVFPNLNVPPFGGPNFQTNLIMPEPCPFISHRLPRCSIVRPVSEQQGGAVAAANALTADGLFIGQSQLFFDVLFELANRADNAGRA